MDLLEYTFNQHYSVGFLLLTRVLQNTVHGHDSGSTHPSFAKSLNGTFSIF